MKLELEDSVLKRAWVLKLWDGKFRRACHELVKREDFDEPTFFLADGIYCVSGKDPASDPNRWLRIQNNKDEWCSYRDVAHLLAATSSKVKRTGGAQTVSEIAGEYTEYTLHTCYQCDETFVSRDGTEPYRDLVDWTESAKPIYEPFCNDCAETREWEKAHHPHYYYCGDEFWVDGRRLSGCEICQRFMDGTLQYLAKLDCGCGLCRENSSRPTQADL